MQTKAHKMYYWFCPRYVFLFLLCCWNDSFSIFADNWGDIGRWSLTFVVDDVRYISSSWKKIKSMFCLFLLLTLRNKNRNTNNHQNKPVVKHKRPKMAFGSAIHFLLMLMQHETRTQHNRLAERHEINGTYMKKIRMW